MSPFVLKSSSPTRFYRPKVQKHELSIQRQVASYLREEFTHINDFHSDYAAGLHLTKHQALVNKSIQSGRGWSDMFIPYPSRGYHGIFLELKRDNVSIYVTRGNRKGQLVADEQIQIEAAFLKRMNDLGYFARFAVGYNVAKKIIDWYMECK